MSRLIESLTAELIEPDHEAESLLVEVRSSWGWYVDVKPGGDEAISTNRALLAEAEIPYFGGDGVEVHKSPTDHSLRLAVGEGLEITTPGDPLAARQFLTALRKACEDGLGLLAENSI